MTAAQNGRGPSEYRAYIFDVDGTLIFPERVIPGAPEALASLKAAGRSVLAVTNNSSFRRHEMAERFRRFGLPLEDAEVFSALVATAQYVAHHWPGARVHVFGNPGLRTEFEEAGLVPVDGADADVVVVGNNQGVTYDWLTAATRALLGGAKFVAVNADRLYVGRDGGLVPGAGAFVSALERVTGRSPDAIIGKPSATILEEAAASVGLPASECLYVGDNPDVDVVGAHEAGMDAALVLTGVATTANGLLDPPEHVFDSVRELAATLR